MATRRSIASSCNPRRRNKSTKPRSCAPLGCQRLLIESGIEIAGAHVVILGRSMIVGKPLALLLMRKGPGGDATVTVVHSRSQRLAEITRSADILVAAIGQREFVRAEHVRDGA